MKRKAAIAALFCLLAAPLCFAWSFLTHETIIDMVWESGIEPVLLKEYPDTTPDQLRMAHAYAYGGSVIQDVGYYPFGSPSFSNLTHYVRTGDFIANLIREAHNVNDLAFALGALSHYVGDTIGHLDAVNPAVAVEFPDLARKYGPVVTYEQSPRAHVRTEFAFDIDQLSHSRFAPAGYLSHVGFKVSRDLLDRAFYVTYGLSLSSVIGNESHAISSYDWAVRAFLPRVAFAEALLHRKSFPPDGDLPGLPEFERRLKETSARNGWEQYRKRKPSFRTRVVAVLIAIMPKVGVLSDLAIRGPDRDSEEKYIEGVNQSADRFLQLLGEISDKGHAGFAIPDLDLDTGYATRPGAYRLTDRTYATLLAHVTANNATPPIGLRQNILAFYSDPNAPIETKKHPGQWKKVEQELIVLRDMPATRIPNAK
jgi:hypothetical protein